ncbi:MAG: cysteine--tRNA ligase [Rikenellaceae bacterium]
MKKDIFLYNSLSRTKELFEPINNDTVGMYVCGPTVYGDGHLGHARSAISFDILFRMLRESGYRVRYVRNITDVGHLENDADSGEDKLAKQARIEKLEPMEVAQHYTNAYRAQMAQMGCLPPSIEPLASGHIIEQIDLAKAILDKGYAYESEGSIYFDVKKYAEDFKYGELSGRNIEDIVSGTRELDGQSEKRFSADFALWKKASPSHIMRWGSPWSDGFPGWHAECSAMGRKYLGESFDIHGGGMDLLFPHHECEIAQSTAAFGHSSAKYWLHNNMITLAGQKMGKSLGNAISLTQFFSGEHKLLERAYSPMVIRFFILTAHYRSTLDFTNEALIAAEKGYLRLLSAQEVLRKMDTLEGYVENNELLDKCSEAISDDMNTPIAIAHLFDATKIVNSVQDGKMKLSAEEIHALRLAFDKVIEGYLGLKREGVEAGTGSEALSGAMELLLEIRSDAKNARDFATSDKIRDRLQSAGIVLKDRADGTDWEVK